MIPSDETMLLTIQRHERAKTRILLNNPIFYDMPLRSPCVMPLAVVYVMSLVIMKPCLPAVRYLSRHPGKLGAKKDYSQNFRELRKSTTFSPEYDYGIGPTTYVYSADQNREILDRYPLVTARLLSQRKDRPRSVKMLAREFIDDSMYHPRYGYFSRTAEIFTPSQAYDFNNMRNADEFLDMWAKEYGTQKRKTGKGTAGRASRQLWHTPSELFHPFYGQALARYMLSLLKSTEDLVIWETGAGNGTLMIDILNYLRENAYEVYKRTSYTVIEISTSLALKQRVASLGHDERVRIVNRSILDWKERDERPGFFLAQEVFDNLAHDVFRYNNITDEPMQSYIAIDANGDFTEHCSHELDHWGAKSLELRRMTGWRPSGGHPLKKPQFLRRLYNRALPFRGNLSEPDYVPTRYIQLLHVLRDYFPKHRMLAADFTSFNGRIEGYNAPVVQTFMEGMPITVSTFLTLQGYFDIMFPTDFNLALALHNLICGGTAAPLSVTGHGQFLAKYVVPGTTKTKAGEDPMLTFYRNAAFLHAT